MSENKFCQLFPKKQLHVSPTNIRLHSYSGDAIEVLGCVDVIVVFNEHVFTGS